MSMASASYSSLHSFHASDQRDTLLGWGSQALGSQNSFSLLSVNEGYSSDFSEASIPPEFLLLLH